MYSFWEDKPHAGENLFSNKKVTVDMGTEWGGKGSRGDFHVNVNVPNGLGFGHWKAVNTCQHSIMELSYLTLA